MTENGPFRPNPDGKTLSLNPFSWNTNANVVYLESPSGVGFSYSANTSDYTTVGDKRTADDSYKFLLLFLQKFPRYQNTPFWITGESYGGHYVPTLARRILDGNNQGGNPKINIQGFMAGNPWTYMPIDNYGAVFYWWSHALISDETFKGITMQCNFSDIGPLKAGLPDTDMRMGRASPADPATCNQLLNDATTEMGNIDIYDIYVDVCTTSRSFSIAQQMGRAGSRLHAEMAKSMARKLGREGNAGGINPPYQPCIDSFTYAYMNMPAVQKALHVDPLPYPWVDCSPRVQYNYSDVEASVVPVYESFWRNAPGLQVLVYSGDVDAIVPIPGTRSWTSGMKRPITTTWTPWIVEQQVGGYFVEYDTFTLATIRNAGHMVPETQPERAFVMFNSFLYNQQLPTK